MIKSVPKPREKENIKAKPSPTDWVLAIYAKIEVSTGVVQGAAISPEEAPRKKELKIVISFFTMLRGMDEALDFLLNFLLNWSIQTAGSKGIMSSIMSDAKVITIPSPKYQVALFVKEPNIFPEIPAKTPRKE